MSDLTFDRRAVLKGAGAAAVGLSAVATAAAPRRRYVNVGVGSRSRMYLTAITKTFAEGNELVAVCDTNPGRLETAARAQRSRFAARRAQHRVRLGLELRIVDAVRAQIRGLIGLGQRGRLLEERAQAPIAFGLRARRSVGHANPPRILGNPLRTPAGFLVSLVEATPYR